jgi:monothiol glutaredoxin
MKGTPDFPQCGFSARTVAVLRALGVPFKAVNIFEDPELREELKRYSNWPTYPQLYVNGELLGGCDIVLEMYDSGELKTMLASAGALAATA